MSRTKVRSHQIMNRVFSTIGILCLVLCTVLFLQTVWAHRTPYFSPEGEPAELRPLLMQEELSREDYDVLFRQTGLSPSAVDDLRAQGEEGVQTVLEIQKGFFAEHPHHCKKLLTGRFTCEDLLQDEQGKAVYSVPVAPLQEGDILITFSTHSLGWRHGHAGLVTDPENGKVLEAAQLGSNSYEASLSHWQRYSNFIVLRVKDAVDAVCRKVVEFADKYLKDIPYSLLSSIFGPKVQDPEEGMTAQCAYLPWLAWESAGVDLDGDGGRVVTVQDLAESPQLEVVQVYGIDPVLLEARQCRG